MEQFCNSSGQDPTSSGGNVLLTGTSGVGKTTVMKGLAAIINSFSGHVRAVYHNFEEVGGLVSPSEDLGFDHDTNFTTDIYDRWCLQNNKCLIYFGDEFDTLYKSGYCLRSVYIARQLLSLGKSTLGMAIICGSSAWTRSLAFKEDTNDARHCGFPNMNCTVYGEYRLLPVREKDQLERVLKLRGRDSLVEHVEEVFCRTGGVGRQVAELHDMSNCTFFALPKIEEYVNCFRYGALIRRLYVANCDDEHHVDYFKQTGLTAAQLEETCPVHYRPAVKELIDRHIFHRNDSNGLPKYEFLYPYHIQRLRELYAAGDVFSLESLALETTLKGWQGFGSAEQVVEALIIRTLVNEQKGPFHNGPFKYHHWEWHHRPSPCALMAGGKGVDYTLDQLYDTVCIPIPDDGLASFVLMRGQGNSVSVGVTHINCGRLGRRIAYGNARSNNASRHFTAILKKANTGWDSLLTALQQSFSDKQFHLTSFALVTNQEFADDVTTLETVVICGSTVPFMVYSKDDFEDDFSHVLRMFH